MPEYLARIKRPRQTGACRDRQPKLREVFFRRGLGGFAGGVHYSCCNYKSSGKRDEVSAAEPDDDEGIELVKTDRWNNEQVHDDRRVVTQEGSPSLAGAAPFRLITYLATLDCATSNPSLNSSPWMRGAPQSGFSTLIRRINTRSSVSICGRRPAGATSIASSRESRLCANARGSPGRMIVRTFR